MVTVIKHLFRFLFSGKNENIGNGGVCMPPQGSKLPGALPPDCAKVLSEQHQLEHRALIYLMTQKTDSVLAALSRTIEQERFKLGVIDSNLFEKETLDAVDPCLADDFNRQSTIYDQIMPLAHEGVDPSRIAQTLALPESEVSMVLRLQSPVGKHNPKERRT